MSLRAFLSFMRRRGARSAPSRPPLFANRYDTNFAAKKLFTRREIVPNRFELSSAFLLIMSVL
jgi:hypothetical protein